MKKALRIVLFITILSLALPGLSSAKETKFDFYYQRLEKVIQINNPEPKGWWEKTKSFVKGVWNGAKSIYEKGITRNFFPGEGKKTWYSEQDKSIAYQVNRVKVRDEAHLLELMGVKGKDLSQLSDGQRALLATYQHSQSKAIKDRMQYSKKSKLRIILSDLTGFEDEKKYPHITKDFWPYASPGMIQMNSKRYEYPGSSEDAKSTFVHEFAHTLDSTMQEFFSPYGKDGTHYANEKTHHRAAFSEGFAEFNQMLDSEKDAKYINSVIKTVKIEDKKQAGKYTDVDASGPKISGTDLMDVEGVNAAIMYRLAKEIPDGREKVFKAFKDTSYPWRSIRHLLRRFVKNNPDDAATVAKILNKQTYDKLSDKEMMAYLGSSDAIKSFLASRKKPSPDEAPAEGSKTTSTGLKPVELPKSTNTNPFAGDPQ